MKNIINELHRFKGADSRSASHIHRAKHYPRKNGKAQQNRDAADRHLLPLYWRGRDLYCKNGCRGQEDLAWVKERHVSHCAKR